ncbi:MAG: hypothetical protein L3J29_11335 [Cyclobacteriaceae bacterium]|nr:hypothetical protein [Cyclobacteriaceae bacterium]
MWLVADSGSTKTEWALFDNDGVHKQFLSLGLNPLFLSKKEFNTEILKSFSSNERLDVTKLWFYGAGCGSEKVKAKTKLWLKESFKNAIIDVNSDMLAAARATCGTSKGLVAILGTGSNSCFFDGNLIKEQVKPLGFILGDEGSGAALGKALLKNLLRNQFNASLSASIYKEIGLNYDEIITKVYRSEWPSRFLATCAKILHGHRLEKEIAEIIEVEFGRFANVIKMYDAQLPVHIIGSVGYYFEEEIRSALSKNDLQLGIVLKSPVSDLVDYHLQNN